MIRFGKDLGMSVTTLTRFATQHRLRTRVDDDLTTIIPGKVGHIYEFDDKLLGVTVIPDPPRRQY